MPLSKSLFLKTNNNMKNIKQLQSLYDKAKGDKKYYSFEQFKDDAKDFLKDCRNRTTYCSMKVSKSGMTRRFNFHKYNMLLNVLYNQKFSWDAVKIGGCGMDMHWHLKFNSCQKLLTPKELEKYNYNSACSSGIIL